MGVHGTMLILDVADPKGERKVDNNVSIGPPEPQAIWPVTDYLHNNTDYGVLKNLYGVYHEVIYTTPGPEVGLASLKFDAAKSSYMTFFNDGSLDGFHAVTWIFYIKPAFQQKAVLMHYEGDGTYPGMELRLRSDDTLELRIYICDPLGCTKKNFKSADTTAPPGVWTLVGITWNKLWPAPEFDIISPDNSADKFEITTEMDHLRLSGNIHFGVSYKNKDYFTGEMSCFQFYNTSIIGKTQKGTPDLCDPNTYTYPEYGDPIGSIDFYNMMLPTTVEKTTQAITTESTTMTSIVELTSFNALMTTDTRNMTTTTFQSAVMTTDVINEERNATTTQSTVMTTQVPTSDFPGPETSIPSEERVQDCCSKFLLVGKQLTLATPTSTASAGSWSSCTRICLTDVTCNYVALDTVSGLCSLSTDSSTASHPTSSVFEKSDDTNC
ncbi:uncharacterized protein LOC133198377 [Saccostrea echinata]|uniref:uncharacterized protein LOC133198377 n=1 Tax=Saccostrea echinata TaxID=191078 RepID=UPI002A7ED842|nr:uncharacterized protein LOC133198377 [Saccostrea echinata]